MTLYKLDRQRRLADTSTADDHELVFTEKSGLAGVISRVCEWVVGIRE
jgi:hypothetical protein